MSEKGMKVKDRSVYKNVQLPVELHKHIKSLAVAEGKSMIVFLAEKTLFVAVKK